MLSEVRRGHPLGKGALGGFWGLVKFYVSIWVLGARCTLSVKMLNPCNVLL